MIQYESTPHYWVNHLGFMLRKELGRAFADAGHECSAEEWALLLVLGARPGLSASELAERTLRDKTTVTRMVDKLVGKGLVERLSDPADRRMVRLRLLKAGDDRLAALAVIAQGLIEQTVAGIPQADIETTVATLTRMAAQLKEGASDGL